MSRKEIGTQWDRDNRNAINENFKNLFREFTNVVEVVSEKAYGDVIDAAKLNWQEPVSSQSDLPTEAEEGDTRMTRNDGKVYRFNGEKWNEIQQIDAGPVNEVERRFNDNLNSVNQQLAQTSYNSTLSKGRLSLLNVEKIFANGIWSWWIYPLAIFKNGRMFFGHTDNTGTISVNSYDYRTGATEKTNLIQEEVDDHNAPAILFTPDDKAIVFYSRHNKDNVLRYRKGQNANSISSLGAEKTVTFPARVAYAQVIVDSSGRLHAFTRVGSYSWHYLRSDDYGETWTIKKEFVNFGVGNQGYLKIKYDEVGNLIRIAFVGHPSIGNVHDIYYCYIRLNTGDVQIPGAIQIGNVYDSNFTALSVSSLMLAYKAAEGKRCRLFDLNSNDLGFVFAEFTDHTDGVYKYANWNGSSLDISPMVETGSVIGGGSHRNYFGGAFIPENKSGEVLLSREDNGNWSIEKWLTHNGGNKWDVEVIDTSQNEKLFRPVAPVNANNDVFWVAGQYAEDNYTDYDTELKFLTSRLTSLENRLTVTGRKIPLTLQNGWTGTLEYSVNSFNQVHLIGTIEPGTIAPSTVLATLPENARPTVHVAVPIFDSSSSNLRSINGLFISPTGSFAIHEPFVTEAKTTSRIRINTIFQL